MKKLLLVAVLLIAAPLAQGDSPVDEVRFTLREELLRFINHDRKQFGLRSVALDPVVSAQADEYCRRQIRNGTTGHFTTDGLAPYMRYSLAGGNDGMSENVAAWSANYSFSDGALYDMMRRSQTAMMAEVAPHDGHRRTILDPHATHVGIGLAWHRGELRIAEEFIRRYVEWVRPLPRNAAVGDRAMLRLRAHAGYAVEAVTVHHEPMPEAMPARLANDIDTYALPQKRREYIPRMERDGSVALAVPFPDGPGMYTVVVWVNAEGSKDAIAASNVSIRVEGDAVSGTR